MWETGEETYESEKAQKKKKKRITIHYYCDSHTAGLSYSFKFCRNFTAVSHLFACRQTPCETCLSFQGLCIWFCFLYLQPVFVFGCVFFFGFFFKRLCCKTGELMFSSFACDFLRRCALSYHSHHRIRKYYILLV